MDNDKLKLVIEGALFASGKAMTLQNMLQLFEEAERPSMADLKQVLGELQLQYQDGAILLKELATGYCFLVMSELSPWISRLWAEKPPRYSRAVLETLAIIAYRQPITRGEIEAIRGVSTSSHIVKSLLEREWVRVVGHRDVPGKPELFATTRQFLAYFALKSLEELPQLGSISDISQFADDVAQIDAANEAGQMNEIPFDDVVDKNDDEVSVDPNTEVSSAEVDISDVDDRKQSHD